MPIDYQQLRTQIKELGKSAPGKQEELQRKRQEAVDLLHSYAGQGETLRAKVQEIVRKHDPSLRCAMPADSGELLNGHFPLPPLPPSATLLAADGSQINHDRHAEVEYSLINVGAIQMRLGASTPPQTMIESRLYYDEQLYHQTDASLALSRDLEERSILARLASRLEPPVITFTDGPVELWGVRDASPEETTSFQESMSQYLQALNQLAELEAITAGYVDKPAANLVVRLLEAARAAPEDLANIRRYQPLARRHRQSPVPGPAGAGRALGSVRLAIPIRQKLPRTACPALFLSERRSPGTSLAGAGGNPSLGSGKAPGVGYSARRAD